MITRSQGSMLAQRCDLLTVAHLQLSVKRAIMICITSLIIGQMNHMAFYGIVWSEEVFYH